MGCNDQRVFECLKVQSCCCLDDFFIRFGWQRSILGRGMSDFFSDKTHLLVDTNIQNRPQPTCFPGFVRLFFADTKTCFLNQWITSTNQSTKPSIPQKNRKNQVSSVGIGTFPFSFIPINQPSPLRIFFVSKFHPLFQPLQGQSQTRKLNSPPFAVGEVRLGSIHSSLEKLEMIRWWWNVSGGFF